MLGPRDLHARVVKARPATKIRQRVRRQRVRRVAVRRVTPPHPFRHRDDAGFQQVGQSRTDTHLTECIEDADLVAILDAARLRVVGVHLEPHLGPWQFAERGADGPIARR